MNKEQTAAVRSLVAALDKCAKAGLQGGVFDTSFCVWPEGAEPHPNDAPEFFSGVENIGGKVLDTHMYLDGGAGN